MAVDETTGEEKDTGTSQENDGDKDGQKTFTQEELDAIIKKRLERTESKLKSEFEKQLNEYKAKAEDNEDKTSEVEKLSKTVTELAEQLEKREKESQRLVFESALKDIAAEEELDPKLVTRLVTPENTKKTEDGVIDYKATIMGLVEEFPYLKKTGKDIGKPPVSQPPKNRKRSEMSISEKSAYIQEHGQEAFSRLPN
jgi:hypothetical protein